MREILKIGGWCDGLHVHDACTSVGRDSEL